MARLRLISIAVSPSERILGCYSTPSQAVAAILSRVPNVVAGDRVFFEDPDVVEPRLIQVRYVANGQAPHLGRILVDRGNVDTVLGELRQGQS